MWITRRLLPLLAVQALLAVGCGSSSSGSGASGEGYYVSIANLTYSPLNLEAPPGATITIINSDSPMTHSVTSEATPGSFVHNTSGISFDTGGFTGTATFTLPQTAPAGTVLNYFCTVHLSTMVTPNGTITVNPNAQPTLPPTMGTPGY